MEGDMKEDIIDCLVIFPKDFVCEHGRLEEFITEDVGSGYCFGKAIF